MALLGPRRREPRRQRVPLDAARRRRGTRWRRSTSSSSAACRRRAAPPSRRAWSARRTTVRGRARRGARRGMRHGPGGPSGRGGRSAGGAGPATWCSSARARRAVLVAVGAARPARVRGADGGVGDSVAVDRDDGRRAPGDPRRDATVGRRDAGADSNTRGGAGLSVTWRDDKFHDECGLFGIWNHPRPRTSRTSDSTRSSTAGRSRRASPPPTARLPRREGHGLGGRRVQPGAAPALPGHRAIGHVRYSTAGSSNLRNAQPITASTAHGPIAIAHNGNLVNAEALRASWSATAPSSSRPPTPR